MQRIAVFTACLVLLFLSSSNTHAASKRKPIESKVVIELSTTMATPGATVTLNGKGFGPYKSTAFNRVIINGLSALVQRWEPELIEVKVPFKATSGFIEVMIGKKKVLAGLLTIVMPQIEDITPTEAERGATLQITGQHFGLSAGARDPNTMFGVNDVIVGGVVVRPLR